MTVRVGILGAGMMGEAHAQAYRKSAADIVGVVDVDTIRAHELVSRFGGEVFPSFQSLLSRGIDAVSICLPHSLHREAAQVAADHGVHILMEKPLANTLEDAFAILNASQTNGVKLMVGFIQRFLTGVQTLHAMIQTDTFGQIGLVVEHLAAGGIWPVIPAWYYQRALAGGGIMTIGNIHSVDRLRWLLASEAETVYGTIRQFGTNGDVEDAGTAVIQYTSGVQASLIGLRSSLSHHQRRWTLDIYGSRAEASLNFKHTNEQMLEIVTGEGVRSMAIPAEDPFELEIQEFLSAIQEDREPVPGGYDGLISLATILAIYESASTGLPVNVQHYLRQSRSASV